MGVGNVAAELLWTKTAVSLSGSAIVSLSGYSV